MKYTGERVIPALMNPKSGMLMEHLARYEFARQYAQGRVLDIACGAGYGSEILLREGHDISQLVGIDCSQEAVDYAKAHYSFDETAYYQDNALNKSLPDRYGTFDTVISFETIEHFHGDTLFVDNLYGLLKPQGTLVISTPFGKGKEHGCLSPYHVYQYTEAEFLKVLKPFEQVTMYHQIDEVIEIPKSRQKYYLMVAVCQK